MNSKLSGKTALVTGSSRGIGRATALGLAREGALVAVHYGRDEQAAKETVGLIEKGGGRAFTVGAQLGTDGAIDQLFEGLSAGLHQHTGTTVLDILVNNAAATGFEAPRKRSPPRNSTRCSRSTPRLPS